MAEHKKDDGGKQSNAKEMPEAGTGSRDLSNWRKLAQARAAMQTEGAQQAGPSAVLGALGLSANGQDTAQTFSELERELKASAELRADPLKDDEPVNVNVSVNVNSLANVNSAAAVNAAAGALAVVVAAAAAAIPVIVLGAGVEE